VGTTGDTFVFLNGGAITTAGTISAGLSASGTPSSTTYLRGDNTWGEHPDFSGVFRAMGGDDLPWSGGKYGGNSLLFTSSDNSIDTSITEGDSMLDLTVAGGPPSDERLKKDIKPVGGFLEEIKKLRPVEFDWNEEATSTFKKEGHEIGLIAQDVEKVFPKLVGSAKDFKTVDYGKLVPILVGCIKDLSHQIRTLNEKVSDLEFKNSTDQNTPQ
jgi:hypothetical protein